MRKHSRVFQSTWHCLAILALLIVAGCATPRAPLYIDKDFSTNVSNTLLLGIVDSRVDKSADLDINEKLLGYAKDKLEDRGYKVVTLALPNGLDRLDKPAVLQQLDASQLASLGPAKHDLLMIVYLEDYLKSYTVMKYQEKMEVTGVLLSKSRKAIHWKDKGIGRHGGGGLLGAALEATVTPVNAFKFGFENLFGSLPKRDKS